MVQEKNNRKQLMEDVNSFFNPDDETYLGKNQIGLGNEGKGELLDTTGTDLLEEYVSYVLGLFFDTQRRWFSIQDPNQVEGSTINRQLQLRAELLAKLISQTNYFQECTQHDWDVLTHGHGLMIINSDSKHFAKCRTINPLDICFMDRKDSGEVFLVTWKEMYSAPQLIKEFPKVLEDNQWKQMFDFQNVVLAQERAYDVISFYCEVDESFLSTEIYEQYKNYKYILLKVWDQQMSTGFKISTGKKGNSSDAKGLILGITGFNSKVVFPVRDYPTRSHPYGKGVGKKILPKARILNSLMRSMIQTSKLMASPPWVVSAEVAQTMGIVGSQLGVRGEGGDGQIVNRSVVRTNNQELVAGQVFVIDPEKRNQGDPPPVELLQLAGKLPDMFQIYQSIREQLSELLPIPGQVYKVARQSISEIQQRQEEQNKRISPIRANYVQEGLAMHLKRFYDIAKKAGKFKDIPLGDNETVTERNMEFIFDAFLLQSRRVGDSLRLAQSLNIVSQFMLNQPGMGQLIDGDKIMRSVFSAQGISKFLLDEQAVTELRDRIQRQVEQDKMLQRSESNAKVLGESGKALGLPTNVPPEQGGVPVGL